MNKAKQWVWLSGFWLASCTGNHTELEQISRHRADSVFQLQIPALDMQLDSMCIQKMEYALQFKLDSIIQQRKSEIIKLQEGL